jgi:hypothetical protein
MHTCIFSVPKARRFHKLACKLQHLINRELRASDVGFTSRCDYARVRNSGAAILNHSGGSIRVRHPPRSGWLDELGRLKGGRASVLGVAPSAPHWNG